jgi:hypothetical protein
LFPVSRFQDLEDDVERGIEIDIVAEVHIEPAISIGS